MRLKYAQPPAIDYRRLTIALNDSSLVALAPPEDLFLRGLSRRSFD
jgi:hypothetical protein